jgi:hypothetical protein
MTVRAQLMCLALLTVTSILHADGELNANLGKCLAPGAGQVAVFRAQEIITKDAANPGATAVAVSGGKIVAVGSIDDVNKALACTPFTTDETCAEKAIIAGHDTAGVTAYDFSSMILEHFLQRVCVTRCPGWATGKRGEGSCAIAAR